jgi:N-formylglutamate amidohydrolase
MSEHHLDGVFLRRDPEGDPAPVVFEAPRSGTTYPAEFTPSAPFRMVHAAVSHHVPALYQGAPAAGAALLWALFPNTFIDANRSPDDIDPAMLAEPWPEPLSPGEKSKLGVGLLRRLLTAEQPLYDRRLTVAEVQSRIRNYHQPYHRELDRLLQEHRRRFGIALHLSLHCMSSTANTVSADAGQERPEFCIGDRHGTTCNDEFSTLVADTLAGMGYRVTRNDPYPGAWSVARHGHPERGIHSVQIEIRKNLYMDERTLSRTERFATVKADLDRLCQAVCAYGRQPSRP